MRIEQEHVVVGNDAGSRDHETRPEQAVDGLRRRNDVAVAIGDRDMRRVGGFVRQHFRRVGARALRIDFRTALFA